jgi:hypothetical protein
MLRVASDTATRGGGGNDDDYDDDDDGRDQQQQRQQAGTAARSKNKKRKQSQTSASGGSDPGQYGPRPATTGSQGLELEVEDATGGLRHCHPWWWRQ